MPESNSTVLKAAERELQELRKTLQELRLSHHRQFVVQLAIETELKKSLKGEKLTKHLIQLMNRSFEPAVILEIIVQELGIFFNVDRCLVVLYQNDNVGMSHLNLFAQYCRDESIKPVTGDDIPWNTLGSEEREVYPNNSTVNGDRSGNAYLENNQIKSAISIEIRYRRITFGRLILHDCAVPHRWTEQEIDFQDVLATHIGAALYQSKLYQQEKAAKHEAEEANKQKSKVLSYVSHDFKNPLSSIDRFVSILENDKKDVLSAKQRELTGYIVEAVGLLRHMVVNILDKCRLAEGKIIPAPEWIELPQFLNELTPIFKSMALQQNIEISIDIQHSINKIKVDPTHLRQILLNLISNALKYNCKNGKVFLRIYEALNKDFFIIEVEDTGIGIHAEKIPKLFVEYFRGNLSQLNLIEGTGLGLAFIKNLIELNGGTITVASEERVGSQFRVTLPYLKDEIVSI